MKDIPYPDYDNHEVLILRRFGGHGGITTEWEITTRNDELKLLIRSLPDLWPIQHTSEELAHYDGHWIFLPEDVSIQDAGTVAALLTSGLWEPDKLRDFLVELQAKCKDRPETD